MKKKIMTLVALVLGTATTAAEASAALASGCCPFCR